MDIQTVQINLVQSLEHEAFMSTNFSNVCSCLLIKYLLNHDDFAPTSPRIVTQFLLFFLIFENCIYY